MFLLYFFIWTFILYLIHILCHKILFLQKIHWHHHKYINVNKSTRWHWNNLFLFNDNWNCTLDLWLSEVIPTIIFSIITEQYWLFLFYYIWAAFLQESLEHNNNIYVKGFNSGKWHLIHHKYYNKNYGLFFPIWDILFNTNKSVG